MENQNVIVQLNNYPKDRYNVLVPVTTMQAASNMQRITVSEVQLDTNKDTTKDIYYEKSSGKYAITKVAGMKLAAAANISIVGTDPTRTEGCQRCIEMARATGKARVCGTCEHNYDVAVTAIIRVPEPSGGFRMMQATKEIDCTMEKSSMTEAQYKRFLPHRTAIAESKAFMRAIRAALGLSGTYELTELRKPFIVARIVPNLDAPEMRDAVAANYLQSMGMLYEMPAQRQSLPPAQPVEAIPEFDDEKPGQLAPAECLPEPDDGWGPEPQPQRQAIYCAGCNHEITEAPGRNGGKAWSPEDIAGYSQRNFKRVLCPDCQRKAKEAGR
ncbi:MAG: hypothetical protein RR949_02615 [Oscillospiraceae bacterium]